MRVLSRVCLLTHPERRSVCTADGGDVSAWRILLSTQSLKLQRPTCGGWGWVGWGGQCPSCRRSSASIPKLSPHLPGIGGWKSPQRLAPLEGAGFLPQACHTSFCAVGHVTDPSPSDGQVFPRIQGRKNTQCPVCQQGLHTPEPPDPRKRLTAQHLL